MGVWNLPTSQRDIWIWSEGTKETIRGLRQKEMSCCSPQWEQRNNLEGLHMTDRMEIWHLRDRPKASSYETRAAWQDPRYLASFITYSTLGSFQFAYCLSVTVSVHMHTYPKFTIALIADWPQITEIKTTDKDTVIKLNNNWKKKLVLSVKTRKAYS